MQYSSREYCEYQTTHVAGLEGNTEVLPRKLASSQLLLAAKLLPAAAGLIRTDICPESDGDVLNSHEQAEATKALLSERMLYQEKEEETRGKGTKYPCEVSRANAGCI